MSSVWVIMLLQFVTKCQTISENELARPENELARPENELARPENELARLENSVSNYGSHLPNISGTENYFLLW